MSHYPEGEEPSEHDIELTLADAVRVIEHKGFPYLLMGGSGSVTFGRPRTTDDIDLFVRPDDAPRVLDALGAAGFDTDETDLEWLCKAFRRGVLVDVIFRSAGDVFLDEAMLDHGVRETYRGTEVSIMSPEDIVVIKALATSEESNRHWYDALSVIARCDLDWDYFLFRARRSGPRRVLSLLLYAESNDLPVPAGAVDALVSCVHRGVAEVGS
jgi:predicted nucleotidyltransferase